MINFESFDVSSSLPSEFVLTMPQRYLHNDIYDLSAEKKQENRSDFEDIKNQIEELNRQINLYKFKISTPLE